MAQQVITNGLNINNNAGAMKLCGTNSNNIVNVGLSGLTYRDMFTSQSIAGLGGQFITGNSVGVPTGAIVGVTNGPADQINDPDVNVGRLDKVLTVNKDYPLATSADTSFINSNWQFNVIGAFPLGILTPNNITTTDADFNQDINTGYTLKPGGLPSTGYYR